MIKRILVVSLLLGIFSGCSNSGTPVSNQDQQPETLKSTQILTSTVLWGLYDLNFDFINGEVFVSPARTAQFTANVTGFLNKSLEGLTIKLNNFAKEGETVFVNVDATIHHPLESEVYRGYDVRGIFIGNGTQVSVFDGTTSPLEGTDQYLSNADGYTRWYNPKEFPELELFGYVPGAFATPGYGGNSTVNPYKYYAQGLSATGNLGEYLNGDNPNKGVFLNGTVNTRNYQLKFPDPAPGVVFNYAIIASWAGEEIHPARAPESIYCSVEDSSNLYFEDNQTKGGDLVLDISIYNWSEDLTSELQDIVIESDFFSTGWFALNMAASAYVSEVRTDFHVETQPDNLTKSGPVKYTIIPVQELEDYSNPEGIPNDASGSLSSYFKFQTEISNTAPEEPNLPGDVPIQITMVANGMTQPINMAAPNDDTGRLFVVERQGRIRLIEDGILLPAPFLDITGIVHSTGGEQGLLSMIFHPDYSTNGYFYVYYISGSGAGQSNVARYQVSGGDPNLANPASAKPILSFTQPFSNHNGGKLQFGNDGYLYISTGDGGSGGDPLNNGQSLNTLLGKLLRIDVDIDPGTYNIPSDNPFVGNGSALDEIWAYGLRNPWQYSFDSLTHDLYIADVGQNVWEEINFTSSESTGGENYGWRIMEGAHCYPSDPCDDTGLQYPVAEYSHAFGCSITGIGVCRASTEPDITGIYFAGDYCSGRIWGLARNLADEWIFTELLDTSELITGAGEDPDGNIYFTTYTSSGALYMIEQM